MTFFLPKSRLIATLTFFAFVLLSGTLYAAAPAPASALSSPQEIMAAKMKAKDLTDSEQYEEAFRLYLTILRAEPDDFDVNLNLARSAWQAKRLPHSSMVYERLIATFPDNAVLHMEYAGLLLHMGNLAEARLELAEAKRLNPDLDDSAYRAALKNLEQQVATFMWSGRVAGGMIYDSNFNTGPPTRGVSIGGIPFQLDKQSAQKESMGMYLHALGDFSWRAASESNWWLVADVSGYQRWYESNEPQRDLTYGRAAMGLRYARSDMLFEVKAKAETLLENGDSSVNIYGVESTAVYALNRSWHFMGRAGVEHRSDISNRERSGTYWWLGPYLRRYFGEANHSIMFGIKVYGSETREKRHEYLGIEPSLTFGFNLPYDVQLYMTAAVNNEDYRGPASLIGNRKDRHDHEFRSSIFFSKVLTEGLRLEAGWQYTDNISNSDLYDYDQHQIMLGLAYHF